MQDLYKELIELLEQDPALIVEGKLNKAVIIDRALKLDSSLLKLLLNNPNIKKQFFANIDGILIFDKIAFQRFVSTKKFLEDSYTQYKNKIGLSTDNENYLTDSREVVLVWPHKDCVLECGQTKEDAKRNEIFYNTTLAPDDIDTLTAPKVFTNWMRYEKGKESKPTKICKEDNLIIKGNNLLALHSLNEVYKGKIKLVYIDPPYNTASTANTFAYNNTFNHSTWLTFMKNRIEVAKILLKPDGVICIAIDDEEYAHLKLLCDVIFGRENYLGTIIVQSNPRGRTINSFFATCRNEKCFQIFRFSDGKPFEPDFVLFLKEKNTTELLVYQLFIEPKGDGYIELDQWKEDFLKEIENRFIIYQNSNYKLVGLPFFNHDSERQREFILAFDKYLN